MDGIGQLNAAGICVADLYRNILIIKVCVQDRFRAGQRIIAYAVDLGIVSAAAGGVCAAVGIGAGEVESGGLPVIRDISSGTRTIILTLIIAGIAAWRFPPQTEITPENADAQKEQGADV